MEQERQRTGKSVRGMLGECFSQLFTAVTNRLDKNNVRGGKIYLGVMISELLVQRWSTPLLWARGEAENQGGRAWWREVVGDMTIRKQRDKVPLTRVKM